MRLEELEASVLQEHLVPAEQLGLVAQLGRLETRAAQVQPVHRETPGQRDRQGRSVPLESAVPEPLVPLVKSDRSGQPDRQDPRDSKESLGRQDQRAFKACKVQ